MKRQQFAVASLLALVVVAGCQRLVSQNSSEARKPEERSVPIEATQQNHSDEPASESELARALKGDDILEEVVALNSHAENVNSEFKSGHVEPLAFDLDRITKSESGFTIKLPSESPVPTPTIYRDRLYVSGGFSSKEYYCFDARTGDFIWGVQLDDDGPSSAVPYDDSIIFGCESCTIFALAANTGEMRWSHWLGDPLLSMPTVADGRVFVVYPAEPPSQANAASAAIDSDSPAVEDPSASTSLLTNDTKPHLIALTHVAACFDAQTGDVHWQRWIDSDCMTAPLAVGNDLYVTSLSGTVYRFGQEDGNIDLASRLRATSVPVVVDDDLFLTRRADEQSNAIAECIALHDRSTSQLQYVAAGRLAPYLDQSVQRAAGYSTDASSFEPANGIGGGFGGGFGGGGGGGGFFAVEDVLVADVPNSEQDDHPMEAMPHVPNIQLSDPLIITQLQAADTIGLGNVSTLQSFQGSRVLHWSGRLYNCMGDRIVCTSAKSGETVWTKPVDGELEDIGGHLATPPVAAGESLFVATVNGDVQQIAPESGDVTATFKVHGAVRFSPAIHEGRIYVSTQDGRVVCIDTGDSTLTGWPMWGGDARHRNVVSLE